MITSSSLLHDQSCIDITMNSNIIQFIQTFSPYDDNDDDSDSMNLNNNENDKFKAVAATITATAIQLQILDIRVKPD